MNKKLTIDALLEIDDTGMPVAPSIRQLMDKDVKELYNRDTTPDKSRYIAEAGVIYQCGDPKSHAKSQGLSNEECLKFAINMYGLPKSYKPDLLVLKLIKKYYEQNITEAGKAVENLQQSIHNMNLAISKYNGFLNKILLNDSSIEEAQLALNLMSSLNKMAGDIPGLVKDLDTAMNNLMRETQTQSSRGGQVVLSSMDAEDYDE